jgi:1-acyl-sn-glycerol-3-phosphate acyltransferase
MILKAKHHFFIYPFFQWYTVWQIRRKFSRVVINSTFADRNLPVLLLANHVSWWDGFWAMYLNLKIFRRKFHFMMLEEQLRKYWFFNYSGGFSVRKKSRSILETLDYTRDLLKNPENLVLVFPQGEIQSMHQPIFRFEPGIEQILKGQSGKVLIVLTAFLTDYFSVPRPGIFLYLREYGSESLTRDALQQAYNGFYRDCLDIQKNLTE